jgi:hypothetical protein
VDLISFHGPTFHGVDNRVAALRLVQKGLCDAALFDPSGKMSGQPAMLRITACYEILGHGLDVLVRNVIV